MWICPKCHEESEDTFNRCWKCGTGRDGSPPAEPLEPDGGTLTDEVVLPAHASEPSVASARPSGPPRGGRRSVMSRYTDAYLIARSVTALGGIVKVIAIAIGGSIAVLGMMAGSQDWRFAFGGVVLAAIVGVPLYVLGVLVAAQGQILKATLDAAVNTSPLLTKDEMRRIMSMD